MHRTYFHEGSLKAVRNQHEVIHHQCTALKLLVCLMCHGTADPGGILSLSSALAESSKMTMGLVKRCQCFAIRSTSRKSFVFWNRLFMVPVRILWENYNPVIEPAVVKIQLATDDSFQQNLLPFAPCAGLWPLQLSHLLFLCWGSTVKWVAQGCLLCLALATLRPGKCVIVGMYIMVGTEMAEWLYGVGTTML